MALRRQARVLTKLNLSKALAHVRSKRNSLRNEVILLLSVKAGLRAKEIANLTWPMVLDADRAIGNHILLTDEASKGRSGRCIPLNMDLKTALSALHRTATNDGTNPIVSNYIVTTERKGRTSPQVIVNMFHRWYAEMGLQGCSSHSGRRTFITNAARKISTVGGSLRDVQALAGHQSLHTTQRYIEFDSQAQSKVVDII